MKNVRIIAMAVATMGVIHIAATFTPLINGGLEVLSPAKQQAMTYMSLMPGMLPKIASIYETSNKNTMISFLGNN